MAGQQKGLYPPSTGNTIPLTKLAVSSLARKSAAPISSSGLPKRPIGVPAIIFLARSVYVPSALNKRS